MTNSFEERQAQIDALIKNTQIDPIPEQKRLLGYARIGFDTPEALTSDEIKQICDALIVHYGQMGIG